MQSNKVESVSMPKIIYVASFEFSHPHVHIPENICACGYIWIPLIKKLAAIFQPLRIHKDTPKV